MLLGECRPVSPQTIVLTTLFGGSGETTLPRTDGDESTTGAPEMPSLETKSSGLHATSHPLDGSFICTNPILFIHMCLPITTSQYSSETVSLERSLHVHKKVAVTTLVEPIIWNLKLSESRSDN